MNRFSTLCLGTALLGLLAAACAVTPGNVYPLEAGYLREATLFARIQALAEAYPAFANLNLIGFSGTEQLPIYALEIGGKAAARNVLILGQHHGDEVLGAELAVAWAEALVLNSLKDEDWARLRDQFRFWIVPTLNPEAFRVVTEGLYRDKRKNNRDTDGNGKLDLRTDGVDLNRNYPVFWDEAPVFLPTHQNYKGSAPASEEELQAIIRLAQKQRFELAILYHSSSSGAYSEKIFLPWLDPGNARHAERYATLRELAENYAGQLPRDYGRGRYSVGSEPGSKVGNARNYFFHIQECGAFLVELGGINSDGVSVIHPTLKQRDRILNKHIKALRKLFSGLLE